MRKVLLLLSLVAVSFCVNAQVATNSGSGLNPTYPDLASAITALNAATITGPVTITLSGNETAPAGTGYYITATGTSVNTITIQGSSSTITAGANTVAGNMDAVFKIVGGDYITIQSFTIQENTVANTVTATGATNTMTEAGILIIHASAIDGAQNNTIQNNIITLSAAFANAVGILSTSASSTTNASPGANSTLAATSTAGTNSNNKFYGNTISSVAFGIMVICPAVTATVFEAGNDIGGTSLTTANTITYGNNTASTAPWNGSSATSSGIVLRNGAGNSARFNTVNTIAGLTVASVGINISNGTTPTGVTYTSIISDNTVSMTNTGTTAITGIDFGHGISTGTIVGSNNSVTINQTATAANSAAVIGIKANYASASNTCSSNTIVFNQSETTGALSGATTALTLAGTTATTIAANSNNITINQTGSGTGTITTTIIAISTAGTSVTNNVQTNTVLINQTTTVASGITTAITGVVATSAASGNLNINTNNAFTIKQGATGAGTYGSGAIAYLSINSTHANVNILNNNFNTTGSTIRSTGALDIILGGSSTLTGLLTIKTNTANIDRVAASGAIGFYTQTSTSPNDPADSISNNTLTFSNLSGTSSITAINRLGGSTSAVRNICNNAISISGTHSGTTIAIACGFSNPSRCNGNNISITCAATTVTGINDNASALVATVDRNTVSITTSAITPTILGITASGTTSPHTITNNVFTALNASAASTSAPTITAITVSAGPTANNIGNNIITGISTGAGSGSATITGISISGGTSPNVFKNKIYGLTTQCTGTSTILSGIRVSAATTSASIYNNLIGFTDALTGVNNADAIRGINLTSTTTTSTINVYYNTIYISSTSTGANFGTTGIYHTASTTATTAALNLRNNIIVNNATFAGTGLVVTYRRSAGTAGNLANYSSTSNNNLFYAGTPSATNLIYSDGTSTAQTISAYKSGVFTAGTIASRDAASFTENPTLLSTSGASANFLHIDPSVATQIESGGTSIASFTDDYDGDTRNGTTPDIGADEGTFLLSDIVGPTVSYSAFVVTLCTTDRTLSATITDASGVNITAGTKPRMYFRKASNTNTFVDNTSGTNGWKYVEASNGASPFSFTTNYSLLFGGTPIAPDAIEYFVVAQDIAGTPNFTINSGTLNAASTTVALTSGNFPVTGANSYAISTGISGPVTIGASGTYTTLTGTGGLFASLNANGIGGAVTATILDASIPETGAIALNQMQYCVTLPTLTIKPASGVTSTLTGAVASGPLVKILSNNVVIDGSNNGTTSRDLTITNTSTTLPYVVVVGSTGTTPTNLVTVKNCIITNGSSTPNSAALAVSDGSTMLSAGYFNNITIQNNLVQKAGYGIFAIAAVSTGNGSITIQDNLLNSISTNAIRNLGIYVQGVDAGAVVTNNTIGNFETATGETDRGIWLATATNGATVSGNTISGLNYTGAGAFGTFGITVGSGITATAITVSNNNISGFATNNGTATTFSGGIHVSGTNNVSVSGNSVSGLTCSGNGTISGMVVIGNSSTINISKNTIYNIKNTTASQYGSNGMLLASTSLAAAVVVSNNLIYDIASYGYSSGATYQDNGYGIDINQGAGYFIYNNSIHLNTDQSQAGKPAAINIESTVTQAGAITLRNNLFINSQTVGTERYAIYSSAPNTVFAAIDNNNYYSTAPLGYIGSTRTTLADIRTGFGSNVNAVSVSPNFTSPTNLVPLTYGFIGTPIPGITTDYVGTTRNTNYPTMGAYETSLLYGSWKLAAGDIVWETNTNWVGDAGPSTTVIIPAGASPMPTLASSPSINKLYNNGTLTISGANTLSITGDLANTGTITGATAGLTLSGTAAQAASLTGDVNVQDFTLNNTAGAVLSGTAKLNVTGTVTINASNALTTGSLLVLKSTASGTARIAAMTTGSIVGNVTQERFVAAKPARTYSFVASPFTQTISSAWQQQVHITGTGINGTVCPTLTAHTNGFDATTTNAASMFVYDGTKAVGSRWTSVTGTTGVNLTPGTGYRMNIRGPRSLGCSLLDGSVSTVTAATLSSTGALLNSNKNYGSFSISLLNNGDVSGSNDNYLLTGNPYPSQVSFAALQTANSGAIDNTYATFAPGNTVGNYAFWNGATWTGGNTGLSDATGDIIANGQAFFIKGSVAGANVTLNWTETMKTASINNGYFRQLNPNRLRIGYMLSNGNKADEIMIEFAANASNDKLNKEDVVSINAGTQNLKSIKAGNGLAFNTRNSSFSNDTVRLNVVSSASGSFKLSFYDFDGFVSANNNAKIYLVDKYTNTVQLMNDAKEYPFTVNTSDAASQGTERFAVVFSKQIAINPALTINNGLKAYPNPVSDNLTVELPVVDGGWTLSLVDISGKIVSQQQVQDNVVILKTGKLAKGSYSVQATDKKGNKQVQKLVKQ